MLITYSNHIGINVANISCPIAGGLAENILYVNAWIVFSNVIKVVFKEDVIDCGRAINNVHFTYVCAFDRG